MDCRGVVPLGVVLMLALTSCAPPDIQTVWPEPRPLGRDIPSYRPPPQPPDAVPPARAVTNPTGVLTLPQAQALALLQHPQAGGVWLGGPRWGGTDAAGQSVPKS